MLCSRCNRRQFSPSHTRRNWGSAGDPANAFSTSRLSLLAGWASGTSAAHLDAAPDAPASAFAIGNTAGSSRYGSSCAILITKIPRFFQQQMLAFGTDAGIVRMEDYHGKGVIHPIESGTLLTT